MIVLLFMKEKKNLEICFFKSIWCLNNFDINKNIKNFVVVGMWIFSICYCVEYEIYLYDDW